MKFIKIVGVVALINLLSRLLGFVRELIVGYQFGTSNKADSLIAAFSIPNFLFIVLGGSVTTAFISIYGKIKDPNKQKQFRENVIGLLVVVLVIITGIMMVYPTYIISHLYFGMSANQVTLTSHIFRNMVPSTFFLVIAMLFTGILNVHGKFNLAAVSTLALNGMFVLMALIFYKLMGVYAHSLGLVVGSIAMVLLLILSLYRERLLGFRLFFKDTKEISSMVKLALPIILGGATLQFYFLLQRIFASVLDGGYISALNYSMKLVQLPQSILMAAITTVIYPSLAKMVASKNEIGFKKTYFGGLKIIAISVIPISIYVTFFSRDLIELIFQHGYFNKASTDITTPILQILVLAMFFHSANLFVTRFFYAREIAMTPVIISVISVFGVNLMVSLYLVRTIGASGVAWGTTISAAVNFVMLVIFAHRRLRLILDRQVIVTVGKFACFIVGQAIVLYVYKWLFPNMMVLYSVLLGVVVWLTVGILLVNLLKFPESKIFNNIVRRIIKKRLNIF